MPFVAPLAVSSLRCAAAGRTCGRQAPVCASAPAPRTKGPARTSSRRVRALFKRAKAAESEGRYTAARELLQQCLRLDSHDAHSWLALANLETRSQAARDDRDAAIDSARAIFRQGLAHCPENVHLLQAFGVLEHRAGDRDAARRLFAKGLQADPHNPYVAQAWGLLEQRVGNKDEARRLFETSLRHRPSPEVFRGWALLESRDGNPDRARDLLRDGLKACETRGDSVSEAGLLRTWAMLEERMGDLPRARELLSKALAAHPRAFDTYVALAGLEARRGSTKQALELMKSAASLSARPPSAVFVAWAHIEWTSTRNAEEARRVLLRGHELHPRDASILQSLGNLEERCGRIETAKDLFARSVQARPTAPAYVSWALLEERMGNADEAVRLFERALGTDPQHGAAYNAYGMMEARRGDIARARAIYERGLVAGPSASVWHGYGQLELKHGRNVERACELFRLGTEQTAEDTAFIWHSWGTLELSQRRVCDARDVFARALQRYPRNSRLLVGAALAAGSTGGDGSGARALFKRAVAADPTHAHAWQAWAVFELRCDRSDAADALFQRGLRLCPTHPALWQAWGVLHAEKGAHAHARRIFERGTRACDGSNVHLLQAWACLEVRCGKIARARELLDQALAVDDSHGPVWTAYGLLEARHGTVQRARHLFRRGIDRAPGHAPLYRTYGETEMRLGQYDNARRLFEAGLQRDPTHAPLYHALAGLEAMLGNIDALAVLNHRAEQHFGGEAGAAIMQGETLVLDCGEGVYEGLETPMQLALRAD